MNLARTSLACLAVLALAACNPAKAPEETTVAVAPAQPAPVAPPPAAPADDPDLAPVEPRAPGTPGGFPDDRTPISEAPFTPQSAQGAADVVQVYFALIGQKKYAEAWKQLRNPALDQAGFVAGFDQYAQYNGQVGAPGEVEGGAGSSFVEVPVQVYGRTRGGVEFHKLGVARLRRVNDVPGSTPEQRLWRIEGWDLKDY